MDGEEKIRVLTTNNYFGVKFWEIEVEIKPNQPMHFCLEFSVISELGVTKTINGTKKLQTWLNSQEGIAWVKKGVEKPIHTGIGTFLKK